MDAPEVPSSPRGKPAPWRRFAPALVAAAGIGLACTLATPQPPDDAGSGDATADEERITDDFVRRFQRAQKLLGTGKDDEAEKLLRELLAEQPDAAAVHHALAYVHAFQGKSKEAMDGFLTAAKLAPDDGAIRRDCGFRLVEAGRFAEALPHLESARRLLDPDVETVCAHGRALEGAGRSDDAETTYREALALDANSVDARALLARHVLGTRPEETLKLLDPVQPNWPDVVEVRALANERLSRWEPAIASWTRLAQVAPTGASGVASLRSSAEGLVRCGAAELAAKVAVRWSERDGADGRPGLRASLCLAVARAGSGDVAGALAALDASPLPEKAPPAIAAHVGLVRAHLLVRAGRVEDARKVLAAVAELDAPFERASARYLLGRAAFGDVAEAAKADAGRANDAAWVAWLGACLADDSTAAAEHLAKARESTRPPGEHPGMLLLGVR
jgi:Flp pilus assembly protein TadD